MDNNVPPISTKRTQKRPRHMALEIQTLTQDHLMLIATYIFRPYIYKLSTINIYRVETCKLLYEY
jgi:hypothetical protein